MPHQRRPSSMHLRQQQHKAQSPHPRPWTTHRPLPHERGDGGRRHEDHQRRRRLDEPRRGTGGVSDDDATEGPDPDQRRWDEVTVRDCGASEVGGKAEGGSDSGGGGGQHRSVVVLKNVLRYAVSLVANRRRLLGSDAFSERQFCGVDPSLPLLDVVNDDGDVTSADGYRLDQWLEDGVFRAIDAGHLRCLTLVVRSSYGVGVGVDGTTCSNKKRHRGSSTCHRHGSNNDLFSGNSVTGHRAGTRSGHGVTNGEERELHLTERDQGIHNDGNGDEEARSVLELFSFHVRDVRGEKGSDGNDGGEAMIEETSQRPVSEQIRHVMEEMMSYLSSGQSTELTSGTSGENIRSRALSFVLEYGEGTPEGFKPDFFTGADVTEPLDRFSSSVTPENTMGATLHSRKLPEGGGSQSQSQEDEELHLHQQSQQSSLRGQSQSTASTPPADGSQATTGSFPTDEGGGSRRSGVVFMGKFATEAHCVAVSCRREVNPEEGVTNLLFGDVQRRDPPGKARRRRARGRCGVDGRSPSAASLRSSSPRPTESPFPPETRVGGDLKRKWRSPSPLSGGTGAATPARSPAFSGGRSGGRFGASPPSTGGVFLSRRRYASTTSSAKEMGLSSLTTTPRRRVKGISPGFSGGRSGGKFGASPPSTGGVVSEVPTVVVPTLTPPRNSLVSPMGVYGSSSIRRSTKTSK